MPIKVNCKVQIFDNEDCNYTVGEIDLIDVQSTYSKRVAKVVIKGNAFYVSVADFVEALQNVTRTNTTI